MIVTSGSNLHNELFVAPTDSAKLEESVRQVTIEGNSFTDHTTQGMQFTVFSEQMRAAHDPWIYHPHAHQFAFGRHPASRVT